MDSFVVVCPSGRDPSGCPPLWALLGGAVALDDFGTGTTSIGQLRHLPVDTLEVDGRFLSADPADQRLGALMVATAHASGLTVVAEGVEHASVLDRLAADACDAAQGYHL